MKKSLLKIFIVLVLCALNQITAFAQNKIENINLDANVSVSVHFAQEILELVNIERKKEHLKPLKLSSALNHYAQIRAKEITKKFAHTRPSGYSCFTVIPKPYRTVGENIAAGQRSAQEVVQAWMDSPGHRENIMNPKFRELGIGYLYLPDSKYKHYWAQLFRRKY